MLSGTALANDLTSYHGVVLHQIQVEAYHKPWMAKTGKTIISEDYGGVSPKSKHKLNQVT